MFQKVNTLLLAMCFLFCFQLGVSAEIYMDEDTQKVWWTGADSTASNRKMLLYFNPDLGLGMSLWTKKSAYTSLNTAPIQTGAAHYVDPMTGLDVKGLNRVYFDGPFGSDSGTQLGENITNAYIKNQSVMIGKAPQKGANYVYAFRYNLDSSTITAELFDARTSESYGASAAPQQVGTGAVMYNRSGQGMTILPGADLSYYWVVGVDYLDTNGTITAFKVSADNNAGVSTVPVKSSIGSSTQIVRERRNLMPWNSEMASVASSTGLIPGSVTGTSKLVLSDYASENIYVYNFDRATGVATLLRRLSDTTTVGSRRYLGASCDFSPSGKYIYYARGSNIGYSGSIYRWDYTAGTVELVPGQSQLSGYIQTARDGRMYVNRGQYDTASGHLDGFGVIEYPDAPLIANVGYTQNQYTFPISTSMDGMATETIGVYVYDSGNAPASYETTVLKDGNQNITYAKHMYDYEVKLGATNRYLLGTTRSTAATLPTNDGVTFLKDSANQSYIKVGKPSYFSVNVSKPGYVSAWLDLDQDGTWQSANDKIVSSQLVTTTGTNQQINITIPYDYASTTSGSTWFRARYSTYQADIVNPVGFARDGEVEDYAVLIEKESVTLTQTPQTGEYTPGQTVSYNISLENTGKIPVTDINIQDLLSSVQALNSAAGTSAAFSAWSITAQNGSGTNIPSGGTVAGTSAGTFNNDTNLNATATIAVGDKLTYTITATVNGNIVGPIVNTANLDLNVVTSDSSRVTQTAESTLTASLPTLEVSKTSPATTYAPNGNVVYTLAIQNTGVILASGIPVVDTLSSITTGLANGNTDQAFSGWTISAVAVGTGSTTGTYSNDSDLNTSINIAPGGSVTYTITGTVVSNAVGTISNLATVNSVALPVVTHTAVAGVIDAAKASNTTTYAPNGNIVYTLTIDNTGDGFAQNIPVTDPIDAIQTTLVGGGTGNAFQANWTIAATTTGTGTTSGSFTPGNNLDTTVTIAPGGSVAYTITGAVVSNAVGTISNLATVNSVALPVVTHTAVAGVIDATKTSNTTTYAPNGNIVYTLTIDNTSDGFAESIPVVDNISAIQTALVGGGTGNAFKANWTIAATTTGTGTTSGSFTNGNNLNTTVTIAPRGSVTYTITGTVVSNAVGTISNSATVNSVALPAVTHTAVAGVIDATKTSNTTTYAPNGNIVYTLTIENTGDGFAQSIPVVDNISAIQTALVGGGTGNAFQANWTIAAATTGTGTTSGSFTPGNNLNTTVTIAPRGSVTYTITGTVVSNAVGTISNLATVNGTPTNTVNHTSATGIISATKTSNTTTYAPNGNIVYTLTIENTGDGFAQSIPVVDNIGAIQTTLVGGGTGNAFQANWTITATTTGTGTTSGSFTAGSNLDTTVTIAPGGSVTYTITGTAVSNAVGTISNSATVNSIALPAITHTSVAGVIDATKTSNTTTYAPNGNIVYTLTINNTGDGFAQSVPVVDAIDAIQTTLVGGGTGNAFKANWTITAATTGTGTTSGSFTAGSNLNTTVTIAPAGSVTYTITGTVVSDAVGTISNSAIVDNAPTNTVSHTSAAGIISATKTSNTTTYAPNGNIVYTLTINNTGDGFAQSVPVVDAIDAIQTTLVGGGTGNAFQANWTITATTTGTGTTSGSFTAGSNLNTTVTIAPAGSVTYTITGTVVSNAVGTISNSATVNHISTNTVNHTSAAGIISATKTSLETTYAPNGTIVYTLTINNTGDGFAESIPVVDAIDAIQTTLVGGGTGNAFQANWTITATTTGTGTTSGSFTAGSNLDTTVTIAPSGSVTYTITGTVVSNAVGTISNSATVDNAPTNTVSHTSATGIISATKTSNTTTYAPNGTIVYTLTINNTGDGFAQSVPVVDNIGAIQTTLVGGGTGNAFQANWTITAATTGTGTTSGSFTTGSNLDTTVTIAPAGSVTYTITGTVVGNAVGTISNSATVNNAPTNTVSHTSAAGIISATKTSSETTYAPNGTIVYTLTINNTGDGFAQSVPVVDNIGAIQTTLVGGGTGNAFKANWTITAATTGTGTTSGSFTMGNNLDTTVTIAPSGSVTYTITGTVVSNAVGTISNSATVNSIALPAVTHTSVAGVISATKTSNTTTYAPNGNIVYTLTIQNTGDGFAQSIPVVDAIDAIQTTLVGGGSGNAFQANWTITATTTGTGTTSGSFTTGNNLDTTVTIAPSGSVTYTITGTVVGNAVGTISNSATVNHTPTTAVNHTSATGIISATKTSNTTTYAPNGTIVYTLTVENTGDGFAESIPVVDAIDAIQTALVGGGTGNAFQANWTIVATTTGTGTTSGSFTAGSNLDTTVTIAPAGSVTYTITGTVVSNAVGTISNSATVNSIALPSVTHTAMAGVISATKISTTTTYYEPNGEIIYVLTINNIGNGFLINVPVVDSISTINTDLADTSTGTAFQPGWMITATTVGTGTTSGSFAAGDDLNTFVTIAPGGECDLHDYRNCGE